MMSTYAVGDLQGCLEPLKRLLDDIHFNENIDTLWLAGDLVNRGPDSLNTLRFIRDLGDAAQPILGNHDLHLIAVHAGVSDSKRGDTLAPILNAHDGDELIDWLRHQPLIYVSSSLGYAMAHAGIPPIWNIDEACGYAKEVETMLKNDNYRHYLSQMYGNQPSQWHPKLKGEGRLRLITNYLTRMRFCDADGKLELKTKTAPELSPKGYAPWYSFPEHRIKRENPEISLLFGHWAALMGKTIGHPQFIGLDTGCVWGEKLTMVRLEDKQFFHTHCDCIQHN